MTHKKPMNNTLTSVGLYVGVSAGDTVTGFDVGIFEDDILAMRNKIKLELTALHCSIYH